MAGSTEDLRSIVHTTRQPNALLVHLMRQGGDEGKHEDDHDVYIEACNRVAGDAFVTFTITDPGSIAMYPHEVTTLIEALTEARDKCISANGMRRVAA